MNMKAEGELIEYRGFKNIFMGLYKEDKQYYIIYGKTEQPIINFSYDSYECYGGLGTAPLFKIDSNDLKASVNIPFLVKENAFFHLLSIDDPKDYNRIISILETIL